MIRGSGLLVGSHFYGLTTCLLYQLWGIFEQFEPVVPATWTTVREMPDCCLEVMGVEAAAVKEVRLLDLLYMEVPIVPRTVQYLQLSKHLALDDEEEVVARKPRD